MPGVGSSTITTPLLAAGVLVLLTACTGGTGPIFDDSGAVSGPFAATEAWPTEIVDGVNPAASSSGSYGWQRCTVREEAAGGPIATAAAYDATTGIGLMVTEERRVDDGQRVRTRWTFDGSTLRTDRYPSGSEWGEVDGGADLMTVERLRSTEGIRSLFDFETVVEDLVDRANSKPLTQEIDGPAGGAELRLEGLPTAWPSRWADLAPAEHAALATLAPGNAFDTYTYHTPAIWLIDAWVTGDAIERIRFQTQEAGVQVTELRFLEVDEVFVDGDLRLPSDCPSSVDAGGNGDWLGYEPWDQTRTVPLQVSLDAAGRPYDARLPDNVSTRRDTIGALSVPGGELLVMDGNAIQVDPNFFADQATPIRVGADRVGPDDVHVVNLDIIWERVEPEEGEAFDQVLGVWVGPSDAEVAAWDDFEYAYGTDGGVGGLIPATVVDLAADLGDDEFWIDDEDYDYGSEYHLADLDGVPGDETFVFSNGFGDGGYPLSRGRNADDEVVVVVIWRTDLPWRVAIPNGRPPLSVTAREDELIECMTGEREISPSGYCRADDPDD